MPPQKQGWNDLVGSGRPERSKSDGQLFGKCCAGLDSSAQLGNGFTQSSIQFDCPLDGNRSLGCILTIDDRVRPLIEQSPPNRQTGNADGNQQNPVRFPINPQIANINWVNERWRAASTRLGRSTRFGLIATFLVCLFACLFACSIIWFCSFLDCFIQKRIPKMEPIDSRFKQWIFLIQWDDRPLVSDASAMWATERCSSFVCLFFFCLVFGAVVDTNRQKERKKEKDR